MSLLSEIFKIAFAAVLGGMIGLERESKGRPAGLKTHMLVTVGAALFTIISFQMAVRYSALGAVDPSRIAAGIVTGIGFLGAGAVMKMESTVQGLTTAASIWAVSAIGMAVGAGFYVEALASTVVVLIIFSLTRFEKNVVHKDHDTKEKV
jgi:putative Mg2+ transporter-C (MgtC) family protein